jgi:hypothetical protein
MQDLCYFCIDLVFVLETSLVTLLFHTLIIIALVKEELCNFSDPIISIYHTARKNIRVILRSALKTTSRHRELRIQPRVRSGFRYHPRMVADGMSCSDLMPASPTTMNIERPSVSSFDHSMILLELKICLSPPFSTSSAASAQRATLSGTNPPFISHCCDSSMDWFDRSGQLYLHHISREPVDAKLSP